MRPHDIPEAVVDKDIHIIIEGPYWCFFTPKSCRTSSFSMKPSGPRSINFIIIHTERSILDLDSFSLPYYNIFQSIQYSDYLHTDQDHLLFL